MKGNVVPAALGEIVSRYATGLSTAPFGVLVLAVVVVASCHPFVRGWAARRPRLATVALGAVAALGVAHAWSLLWASDDAYISFRYARNLVRGHGLVYNPGERVEGYTDFLWTVLMAVPVALGLDPGLAAILVSLASFVVLLWIAARLAERLCPGVPVLVGLGPLLLAASYTVASFATAGLETVFAAMLALLAVERAEARKPLAAGFASLLAALSHPDHAIFSAVLGGALLLAPDRRKVLPPFLAPFVFVFVPYFFWRWSYYGDLMPNTYYAKSGDLAYFGQGTIYAAVTLVSGGLLAAAPLAAFGMWATRKTVSARFAMAAVPLFVVYVMKIGGDFMLGRLFTSVIVLVSVFADVGFRQWSARSRNALALSGAALAAAGAFPVAVVAPGEIFHGIADERTFTVIADFRKMTVRAAGYDLGQLLHREFTERGLAPRFGIHSIGMAGYYSDAPVFDLRGLTSRSVAHLPIRQRGRPGHEKLASVGHLVEAKVDFSEIGFYPRPYDALGRIQVGGFSFAARAEVPAVFARLSPAVRWRSFAEHLDRALPRLGSEGPERLQCDLWHMKEYYFSQNADAPRRQAVVRAAVRADPTLEGVGEWLLDGGDPAARGFRKLLSFSFEPGEPRWEASGDAPGIVPAPPLPDQDLPFGFQGWFVDSYTSGARDLSTVTLTSPPFTLDGDVLTFHVGGGFDPANLTVSLVADGVTLRSATGCSSEWMGARAWDLRPVRGLRAEIVIRDASTGGWGHLLVDEIAMWRAP